jgi:hypothetical protein
MYTCVCAQVLYQRFPNWGMRLGGGGGQVFCMRDTFILNEIWAQSKVHILVGTLLGYNIFPIT